jgi:hypothetical protein
MKLKITKRDLGFFFLGVFVVFFVDLIFNWNDNIAAFKRGFNDAIKENRIESTN